MSNDIIYVVGIRAIALGESGFSNIFSSMVLAKIGSSRSLE